MLDVQFKEEKSFYDILVELRNKHGFPYADKKSIGLSRKIKDLIDGTAIHADWLNNNNLKNSQKSLCCSFTETNIPRNGAKKFSIRSLTKLKISALTTDVLFTYS